MRPRAIRHGDRRVPGVALTFDDGPGAATAAVLDVLRDRGARATFDVLGERIRGRERLLRRAVDEGHEIGVHGWSHVDHRDLPFLRARAAARTAELIANACDVRPRLFRPPFGLTSPGLQVAVALHGLRTVLWDVDPRDVEEPGPGTICDRTLAAIRPGSIVLLHDDRPELLSTALAVDLLLDELHRRGWSTFTVTELLAWPPTDGPRPRAPSGRRVPTSNTPGQGGSVADSTQRSSSRRAKRNGTSRRAARTSTGRAQANVDARPRTAPTARSDASVKDGLAGAAQRARGPAVASGAAVAGLAAGTLIGSKLRRDRRPRVLGLPMPRSQELKSGARQVARAGRWMADMQADMRAVRAQAEQSRRQSPIEVVLSALTSRRLPSHSPSA